MNVRKIIEIIPVLLLLVAAQIARAQNERVRIMRENVRMTVVMADIEGQTRFLFGTDEGLDLGRRVSVKVDGGTVKEALDQMVAGSDMVYEFSGGHIFLSRKKETPQPRARRFSVSGIITDSTSGETLIGAGAMTGSVGSVTNNYGFYSLSLPEGRYAVEYSYLGYEGVVENIDLRRDTMINIAMVPSATLQESIVVARKDAGIRATRMGALEVPDNLIRNAPAVLGEADVLKTLQMLPGIQGGQEGFTGLYVRGGGPDENLMLLDGVPIYNVSHMLGIFSVFTPEVVKKVTVYKSSFPARYSGRISSVVDVITNDGNNKEFHGLVSVGLTSSKVHLEGPAFGGRTSYSVGLRGMHTFLVEPLLKVLGSSAGFYFYDANAKVTQFVDNRNKLIFSFYNGRDNFRYDKSESSERDIYGNSTLGITKNIKETDVHIRWGNTVVAGRWNHVFSGKLFSNTTVAWNRYRMNLNSTTLDSDETIWRNRIPSDTVTSRSKGHYKYFSGIRDMNARIDFEYTPVPSHIISFGGEYIFHTFRPESTSIMMDESADSRHSAAADTTMKSSNGGRLYGHETSLYVEDDFKVGDRLSIDAGVHLTMFATQGKTYFSPEPRLSARYSLGGGYAVKASYTRMSQYVHLLTSTSWSLPTDLWVPITKNIKPVLSDQYSAGAYYSGRDGWEFSLEGYYKSLQNVLEYKDSRMLFTGSLSWDKTVGMGEGRAFGVEFLAQKTKGKTTGWLSYTLSRSDRIFRDGSINSGRRFPYTYDRRHLVNICMNHRFSGSVDLSAVWSFASGGTMTVPTRQSIYIGPDGYYIGFYYDGRNNYRLPASHHLDLSVNFRKQKKHGERIWNIGIYNIYGARNPNWVVADFEDDVDWKGDTGDWNFHKAVVSKRTFLTMLPSFSYTFKF